MSDGKRLGVIDLVSIFSETGAFTAFLQWEMEGRFDFKREEFEVRDFPDHLDNLIAVACGYSDAITMSRNYKDSDQHRLELLAGEHGWCIYHMLSAQKEQA